MTGEDFLERFKSKAHSQRLKEIIKEPAETE